MYKKREQMYDAECFVVNENDLLFLNEIMTMQNFTDNENLKKMFENGLSTGDDQEIEKSKVLMSAIFSKNTFNELKKQNQFKKINVIVFNVLKKYDELLNRVADTYKNMSMSKEMLLNYEKYKNRTDLFGENAKPFIVPEVQSYLKATDIYKEYYLLNRMNNPSPKTDKEQLEMDAIMRTAIQLIDSGLTLESLLKNINIAFRRYEVDIENEKIAIYNSYATIHSANPRKFKPWEGHLYEELESEKTFKEIKKATVEEYDLFEDANDAIERFTASIFDDQTTYEKLEEKSEKMYGSCPIRQLSTLHQEFCRKIVDDKVLSSLSFILANNLVKKEVEKKRVLKNKNNSKKKKKGASQYKSIVREWYAYDREKIEKETSAEVFDGKDIKQLYKKYKEKRDFEYKKEEWEVRPHKRTLKDGREILISGQKRKRKKELLETSSNEPNGITYGMSENDVKKIVKNATE